MATAAPGAVQHNGGKFGSFYTPPPGPAPPGMVWFETTGQWMTPEEADRARFLQEEAGGNTGVYPQGGSGGFLAGRGHAFGAGLVGGIAGAAAAGPVGALYGFDKASGAAARADGFPDPAADNTPAQITEGQRLGGLAANGTNGAAYAGYGASAPGSAGVQPVQPGAPPPVDVSKMPISIGPSGPAPSFGAVNQQASDVTAGLRAQLAGLAPRPAPQAAGPPPAQTTLADAGTLQRAAPISASLADPTTLQRTGAITDTTVDQGAANQTRAQQETSLAGLRAAATGAVPSAAELQLRQTTDQNVKNQYALAAALQGRSAGGALKQASDATGDINAKAAADAAVLRAGEQAAARTAESTALSGVRTADLGVAEKQADISQLTKTTNQATDVTQNKTAADLDIKGKQFNAGQLQTAATQNQNTAVGENKTQYQGGIDVSTTNANNATGVSKFNNTQAQALAIQNTENQLKQTQLDDTQKQVIMNAVLVAEGRQIEGVTAQGAYQNAVEAHKLAVQLAATASSQADRAYYTNLVGTLVSTIAALYSGIQKGQGNAPATQIPGVSPGTTGTPIIPIDTTGATTDPTGTGALGADDFGNTGIPDGGT